MSKYNELNKQYWNEYYKKKEAIELPSAFSKYIMSYLEKGKKIVDLGCGNGRDSLLFHDAGLGVTAIDESESAIELLKEKYRLTGIDFVCDDFVRSRDLYEKGADYYYSRFTLHAIPAESQDEVIENVYKGLSDGGLFFIEVRSVLDEIFGLGEMVEKNTYIYNGHFRRFIVRSELVQSLKDQGFQIVEEREEKGFAPFGDSDPIVIRIIARK